MPGLIESVGELCHMDVAARLGQIEKISLNARTAWFGLLALLVFIGVTLMGHRDSDFFAFGAETQLPLLNIAVPTEAFFIAAPVLAAALYIYLHIYLNGLWVALAKAPSVIEGDPLDERIYPSMLGTAALILRRRLRAEPAPPVKSRGLAPLGISLLMTWLFGWVVLAAVWVRSWPYHEAWLSLWIAFWLWLALIAGIGSFLHLILLMRHADWQPVGIPWRKLLRGDRAALGCAGRLSGQVLAGLLLLAVLSTLSLASTTSGFGPPALLASADLREAELTRKPKDWLRYALWLEEWERQFRQREGIPLVQPIREWPRRLQTSFEAETRERWILRTRSLDTARLAGRDLIGADLTGAFLAGADLRRARLTGATLRRAELQGAALYAAGLKDANLAEAQLQGADLRDAHLAEADLRLADLTSADITDWYIDGSSLRGVNLSNVAHSMKQRMIDAAFGDGGTLLPPGLVAPCHWDKAARLKPIPFLEVYIDLMYLTWRDAGANPVPRRSDGSCPQ